jgi:hypothetical protein
VEYFKEGYGLVTENDPITENCNLFYAQYLALKTPVVTDLIFYRRNMKLKVNETGLYNRRSEETLPVRSVSKDEILGFMTASAILKTEHADKIWKHLLTHLGSYNNTGRLLDYLPFNPGNYYNWGQLVGSKLSYIFLPMFIINLIIASNKPVGITSSKILYWLIFKTMPKNVINNFICKYYERKMKSQYGENYIRGLYNIYFSMESKTGFPLFKLTEE